MHDDIAAKAREWIGTPFVWEQSAKGLGCDCKGLVAGIARELDRPEAETLEARFRGYSKKIDARGLIRGLQRLFDKVAVPEPGDILLIRVAGKPQHMAIYVGNDRMVHTQRGVGKVMEVPVGKSRPIDSIWRWRDLDG